MSPLELDFLTHVTNVHWEDGLAVIFGPVDTDAPPQQQAPAVLKRGKQNELSGMRQRTAR